MRSTGARLALAVLVVGAVVLAACGGLARRPTSQPSRSSGVFGIVLISGGYVSPTASPRPLPGGFVASPPSWGYPFAHGRVRMVAKTGAKAGKVVATVRPDAQGLFRVTLAPGKYVLWLVHGGSSGPTSVTDHPGVYARVELFLHGF